MAKNRYKGDRKAFIGQMRVLSTENPFIKRVVIDALNDKVNRNNWQYINLEKHLPKFRNIPLLTAYLPTGKIGDGHNFDMKTDPKTGKRYASFTAADAERIVGWTPESAKVELVNINGVTWVRVEANLWAWYSQELVSQIVGQGNDDPMEVSIETLILSEHTEGDVAVEEEYEILGITILGRGVAPAVAGATLKSLADLTAMRDGMKEMRLKAASYDTSTPATTNNISKNKGVKSNMVVKAILDEMTSKFNGYTVVGMDAETKLLALVNAKGEAFSYRIEDSDKGNIIEERIQRANTCVTYKVDSELIEVETERFNSDLFSKLNAAVAQNAADAETIKNLNANYEAMRKREDARRLNAAREAAKDELAQCNGTEGKFGEETIKTLMERIENGYFTGREDSDGNWLGESEVRMSVKALCMDEQKKLDKARVEAEVASRKNRFDWNIQCNSDNNATPATIGELFK